MPSSLSICRCLNYSENKSIVISKFELHEKVTPFVWLRNTLCFPFGTALLRIWVSYIELSVLQSISGSVCSLLKMLSRSIHRNTLLFANVAYFLPLSHYVDWWLLCHRPRAAQRTDIYSTQYHDASALDGNKKGHTAFASCYIGAKDRSKREASCCTRQSTAGIQRCLNKQAFVRLRL